MCILQNFLENYDPVSSHDTCIYGNYVSLCMTDFFFLCSICLILPVYPDDSVSFREIVQSASVTSWTGGTWEW